MANEIGVRLGIVEEKSKEKPKEPKKPKK